MTLRVKLSRNSTSALSPLFPQYEAIVATSGLDEVWTYLAFIKLAFTRSWLRVYEFMP